MGKSIIEELLPQVRHNAMVSDAAYWGYYSTCGLLLRLREQYRFEHDIAPDQKMETADVSAWIEKREANWHRLEDAQLRDIVINKKTYRPFDADAINEALAGEGFVYGGGHGVYMKPVFFLAKLTSKEKVGKITVLIAGRELARDLSIHPAMSRGNTIIARRDMVYAMLRDRIDEHKASKRHGLLSHALREYGIDSDAPEKLIQEAADSELASYIHHEAGEIKESRRLGAHWTSMIEALGQSRTGLSLRGVKDALADTVKGGMLGHIIRGHKTGSLFFLIASLTGHRYTLLAPLRDVIKDFPSDLNWSAIEQARIDSYKAADSLAQDAIKIYRSSPPSELEGALSLALKSACPTRQPKDA